MFSTSVKLNKRLLACSLNKKKKKKTQRKTGKETIAGYKLVMQIKDSQKP